MPAKTLPKVPAQATVEKDLVPYLPPTTPVLPITNAGEYLLTGDDLRSLKVRMNTVTEMKKGAMAPITQLRGIVSGWFDPVLKNMEAREFALKQAILKYDRDQEDERRRLEAQLRDQHAADVALALAEANQLHAEGKHDEAEAVIDEVPSLPVVVSAKPKLQGVFQRDNWHAEVKDFTEFLLWCVDHDRLDLLLPNQQALDAMARQTKGTLAVGGVNIHNAPSVVARQ